jgi:hypothetical protein
MEATDESRGVIGGCQRSAVVRLEDRKRYSGLVIDSGNNLPLQLPSSIQTGALAEAEVEEVLER